MTNRYDELVTAGISARDKSDEAKWELGRVGPEAVQQCSRAEGRSLRPSAEAIGVP